MVKEKEVKMEKLELVKGKVEVVKEEEMEVENREKEKEKVMEGVKEKEKEKEKVIERVKEKADRKEDKEREVRVVKEEVGRKVIKEVVEVEAQCLIKRALFPFQVFHANQNVMRCARVTVLRHAWIALIDRRYCGHNNIMNLLLIPMRFRMWAPTTIRVSASLCNNHRRSAH